MVLRTKLNLIFWIHLVLLFIDGQCQLNLRRVNCQWYSREWITRNNWRSTGQCEIPIRAWESSGPVGPKGDKGEQGNPGMPGLSITRSIQGRKGEPGERGPPGNPGGKGEWGQKGDPGNPSFISEREFKILQDQVNKLKKKTNIDDSKAQGPKGDRGHKGDTGQKGQRGEKGEPSKWNDRISKGEKGEPGAIGPVGPQGPKGEPTESVPAILTAEDVTDILNRIQILERKMKECSCGKLPTVNMTVSPPPLPVGDSLRQKLLNELRISNDGECVSYALQYYSKCSEK
ncbi:collagen alpha-1(XIX) chain-like [Saccostrea echinata]|uniref:collagen alpha-1(XIX) chain-like n=1 Tax=Saccostrea echinata TaxID=191078 RepID=UPI002A7F76E5|nr:collagen alpha-1(XIX) chain-like [Saccostrea echinata]